MTRLDSAIEHDATTAMPTPHWQLSPEVPAELD
jgi:hypothetical protein